MKTYSKAELTDLLSNVRTHPEAVGTGPDRYTRGGISNMGKLHAESEDLAAFCIDLLDRIDKSKGYAERACTLCRTIKPRSEFYTADRRTNRLNARCKACFNAHLKKRYTKDEYKEAKRKRQKEKRASGCLLTKARDKRSAAAMRAKHPEKVAARNELNRALRAGKVVAPTHCTACGDTPAPMFDGRRSIQAHHHAGYDNPLNVLWLCSGCHVEQHRKERALGAEKKGE